MIPKEILAPFHIFPPQSTANAYNTQKNQSSQDGGSEEEPDGFLEGGQVQLQAAHL